MESLTALRSSLVTRSLEECASVKVKRLFLYMYMAEEAGHRWRNRIDVADVSLGSGPRSLVRGGAGIAKYGIVVPKELADHA